MAASALPSFKVGQKELFLPTATLAFLRGRNPYNAKFRVPLSFSKLDLRDYLWHVYRVEVLSVRSYVKQQRVQSGKPGQIRPAMRRWHRPKAHKFMTVDLASPFVWPEDPEDLSAWSYKHVQASDKEQEEFQERYGSLKDTVINKERRERMREQAQALLEGKARWRPASGTAPAALVSRT